MAFSLYLVKAQSFPTSVTLHRILQNWGEGTSSAGNRAGGGADATAGDATWLHTFYATSLWNNPGGDFAGAVSAATIVGAQGSTYTWASTAALVSDVQGWVGNPNANFGWLLQGDETQGGTAKAFGTHDNSNAALRPALTVEYHIAAVPEPATACTGIALVLLAVLRRERRRSA